ncbi:MAG: hypothetical protein N2647_05545 [Thermodesulfovibrio sp.]|nr:hypothetical protein [Thermodesulfovibrio sp.]
MREKIVKFPYISAKQRIINSNGEGCVPCEVSQRWLQFPKTSDSRFIKIDVMTVNMKEKDRKICELVITKEDLMRAINSIEFSD